MKTNYFKKMNNAMRLWGIPTVLGISLILLGLGIVFILDLKVLATVISSFMFLSGLLGFIHIYTNKKRLDGWSFYLTLAGLDFVLATLLLTASNIEITTLSMVLSFWILFQGLGKIIHSMDVQKLGVRDWDADLIAGILFVSYGVISIFLMTLSPAFILLATAIVLSLGGLSQISISWKRQAEYKSYMYGVKIVPVKAV